MTEAAENLPYWQQDFLPTEFRARRARLAESLGTGVTAVLPGGGSTGAFDIFRQTNDFFYLCGVEVPHAYLRIVGGTGHTTLYLPPHDPSHEASEGRQFHADDPALVCGMTGVDEVRPLIALAADVREASVLATPLSPGEGRQACRDTLLCAQKQIAADPWDSQPTREERFRERLAKENPTAEFRDLSPLLDALRLVKSPAELAVMRRAGKLTALAVTEAMRNTRPGIREYHLGAVADYLYLLHGARGGGYRPIIAGGANIWNAHYYRNNSLLHDGDLVLMDYAPDVSGYTSDIGRIWPVGGKYTDVQRELHDFILTYHRALLALIRPGAAASEIHAEAAARMEPIVTKTRWSKPAYDAAARRTLTFTGHLSHSVGMAVHDVGDYTRQPLVPGVVFALDPQMWIPEERLYVRVEDTVAVTADGVENLTADAPADMDAIERTIHEPGTPRLTAL